MGSIGIAKLKARLSTFLEQVKAGKELVVTERGVPIAKLVPISPSMSTRREVLAKAGLLQLGAGRIRKELSSPPKGDVRQGAAVLEALLTERETGR